MATENQKIIMNQIADYQMKEIINKDKLYKQLQMMREEQRQKPPTRPTR